MAGRIWVPRDLWDDSLFRHEKVDERGAYLWLLKEASWKARTVRLGLIEVSLRRGQLAASGRFMADKWKWNDAKVRRFLKKLEDRRRINRDTDAGINVITICDYETIQLSQCVSDAASSRQPTQDQRVDDAKQKKEKRKEEKEEEGAGARLSDQGATPPLVVSILEAVGLTPDTAPRYWQGPGAAEHVARWGSVLGLSDTDIVAEAKASRAKNPEPPDGPKALDRWMEQAAKSRAAGPSAPVPAKAQPVPKTPAEQLDQFAGWINGDGFFPASAASPQMCRDLLKAGLVTPERLRERGLTF